MPTASSKFSSPVLLQHLFVAAITFNCFVVYASSDLSVPSELERGVGQRGLKTFQEKPTGTNVTFDCHPSGPCVPCLYSEKKDEKFRCSETGYRIPLRCIKIVTQVDEKIENKKQKERSLLEDSSGIEVGKEVYVTHRSCIPAIDEEKLSVIGFEAIMLVLLAISSFVIYRRKGSLAMQGFIRVPTNPRF
ncbi:hypothetical protein L1887_15267 [Cichorium endivia]|nr:hypothetical protein L1887_15267 [Cichorium endivia]